MGEKGAGGMFSQALLGQARNNSVTLVKEAAGTMETVLLAP